MSIILKPSALKVKDDNGNYIGTNMFAAESTQEYLDAIETIGTQTQTAISTASTQAQSAMEAKAEQTIESIPDDYTELAGDVTELKADLTQLPNNIDSDATGVDLDISDPEGNVILRLESGHLKTKSFDSNKVSHLDGSNATGVDLDISDRYGNILVRFDNGHVRTKLFDSEILVSKVEGLENPVETLSASKTYVRGISNTITINDTFVAGEEIYYHIEDGNTYHDWGRYATYYEGAKAITGNRRGTNGYYRHVVTEDCSSVSAVIGASEYEDGTPLTFCVYRIRGAIAPKVVTVKADGTGMFATLRSAVESITDANALINPYVIEVYPGTYDTLVDYTEEEINSAGGDYTQTSMVGVKLTDGMSIRGIGNRDDIILTASLSSDDYASNVRERISTLNIQGSGSIENLTILASNIRYCVHDDFTTPVNSHPWRILRNLKFGGEQLNTTYGAGAGCPRDYLIEDCDFWVDLGIHTLEGYAEGCTIKVNNCRGRRFRIGDYASSESDAMNRVMVNNCDFQVIRINHVHDGISSHITLEGVGCEQSMICDALASFYRLGSIDIAPAGLATGMLVARSSSGLSFVGTSVAPLAHGIVIGSDEINSYIQRTGYISSLMLGLTGLSVGDYVTVDNSNMVVTGGTSSNAIGVVAAVDDSGTAYIKMLIGG